MAIFALILRWFWSDIIFRPFRAIAGFSNRTFGLILSYAILVLLGFGMVSSGPELTLSLAAICYFGHIQVEAMSHRQQIGSEIASIQTRVALLTIITTVVGVLTLIVNIAQGDGLALITILALTHSAGATLVITDEKSRKGLIKIVIVGLAKLANRLVHPGHQPGVLPA